MQDAPFRSVSNLSATLEVSSRLTARYKRNVAHEVHRKLFLRSVRSMSATLGCKVGSLLRVACLVGLVFHVQVSPTKPEWCKLITES